MHLFFPYNEILPKKKAHDLFLFQECAFLAQERQDVTLLIGKGSLPKNELGHHYHVDIKKNFKIEHLPIIRKNNPLGASWNFPFFYFSQKRIKQLRPDIVFLSVFKQGCYHLERKIPGVKYVYEVHELAYYPHVACDEGKVLREKEMLSKVDLIFVTTEALKTILKNPPYCLKNAVEVIPLAVNTKPLKPITPKKDLHLTYVGQLYAGQGISLLLRALAEVPNVTLDIFGGKKEEIAFFQKECKRLSIDKRAHFFGFQSPAALSSLLQEAQFFVAPFEPTGRMPYVAHTKLFEYASWQRPFLAPALPVVTEHFFQGKGVYFFEAGNLESLKEALIILRDNFTLRIQLQNEILQCETFHWPKRVEKILKIIG